MSGRAAFFDVDGTIVASDIVRYGVEIRTAHKSPLGRWLWIAGFLPRVPWYLALDAVDRARFQRAFYRIYRGLDADELERRAEGLWRHHVAPRVFPQAVERIRRHAARGDRVVLVTGSARAIVAPLAESLGVRDVLAPALEARAGRLTGALEGGPLAGARKAEAVVAFAAGRGIDRTESRAYADSLDDLPLLESVGRPAVVNPGRKLLAAASARGWDVFRWSLDGDGEAAA